MTKKHIFLTGEKQIGKSTLIKKALEGFTGQTGGFYTIRTDKYLMDRYSVHINEPGKPFIPDENNLMFICKGTPGQEEMIRARFNTLGCSLLDKDHCQGIAFDLIIMDELGSREKNATAFRDSVMRHINSDTPILGVLQAPADEFWPEITNAEHVEVIEITRENRNDLDLLQKIKTAIGR